MDTPATESNASLSVRDAAALFDSTPEPQQEPAQAEPALVEAVSQEPPPPEATQADADPDAVGEEQPVTDETITIEVDGKTVEVKKSELPDIYKNGLRQADYTRKTMEAAEQRKAAEAEATKAREERQKHANGLQQAQAMLAAVLQEQQKIDWHALRESDPVEFLKQQHLFNERQAAFQQNHQNLARIAETDADERSRSMEDHLKSEHQVLLDKLPEWKDPAKAKSESEKVTKFLLEEWGFTPEQLFPERDAKTGRLTRAGISDHRAILMARESMLYREMMSKAQAAAKKVSQLPQKVERPGGGETNPLDGRTTAMKQLSRSGSVRDAAAVFDRMFK